MVDHIHRRVPCAKCGTEFDYKSEPGRPFHPDRCFCPECSGDVLPMLDVLRAGLAKAVAPKLDGVRGHYNEYLKTAHWKRLRAHMLERAEYRCERCGTNRRKLNVHHKNYEHIGYESAYDDLEVLCDRCHEIEHGIRKDGDQ